MAKKPKPTPIPVMEENDEGWTDWQYDTRWDHYCCDCYLCHEVQIQIHNGKIRWRMSRLNEETRRARISLTKRKNGRRK